MPNKFVAFNGIDQNNLASPWITDGTSAGTSELSVTGASANGLNPTNFTQFGGGVAFEGTDAAGQNGLWVTDGTSAGTSELSVSGAAPDFDELRWRFRFLRQPRPWWRTPDL
jgi:ELWxxDGT repeat protein